jgi:DNA mismatch repair ATPase MutS
LRLLRDACAAAGRFLAFIDEPLLGTSLTQGHTTRRAVIEDLAQVPGGMWFVATHDLELATTLCDRSEVTCLAVTPWRAVQAGNAPELLELGIAPDTDPAEVAAREYFGQRGVET